MDVGELPWTAQAGYPVLATLQLLPLVAVIVLLLLRGRRLLYPAAIGLALLELLLACDLFRLFDATLSSLQLAERLPLLPFLAYHAAADGMSVLFVLLTAVLSLLVVLYAKVKRLANSPAFLATVFAIQATLQGMFVTLDLLWFTLLSAMELVLIAYLLQRWAEAPQDESAMQRYLQFMGIGLLLLLAGTFMLGWNHANVTDGQWSFELNELALSTVPPELQSAIFFLLFYGLGIRIPLFPLHGWLPLVAEHGTIAVAGVFLLGLKTGVFALVRFVFPLLPEAVLRWQHWVVALALTGIFYAATLALMQINLRRLLAFAVISHTSVLVIGLFSLSQTALQGSILLSITFGTATAGLLFMSGVVFRRTRTLVLSRLGGLFGHLPVIGTAFLIAGLSIIGMPGTPGFDAAHLMLEAAIRQFGAMVTIGAALGNVVAAAFLLWAFQRTFLAPLPDSEAGREIEPPARLERGIAVLLILILLGTGFYSHPWLNLLGNAFGGLPELYTGGAPHGATPVVAP
jgi:NADH-quinone oxidoreductase subunit M